MVLANYASYVASEWEKPVMPGPPLSDFSLLSVASVWLLECSCLVTAGHVFLYAWLIAQFQRMPLITYYEDDTC